MWHYSSSTATPNKLRLEICKLHLVNCVVTDFKNSKSIRDVLYKVAIAVMAFLSSLENDSYALCNAYLCLYLRLSNECFSEDVFSTLSQKYFALHFYDSFAAL